MVHARSKKAKVGAHSKAMKAAPKGKAAKKARPAKAVKAKKLAPKKRAKLTPKKRASSKGVRPGSSPKTLKSAPKRPRHAAQAKAVQPKPSAPKSVPPAPPLAQAIPLPGAVGLPSMTPLAPAVERALAQAEVEGLINRLPLPVQLIVRTLRALVLEAAPEASEVLEDGTPSYFVNGIFARIVPSEREVLIRFLKGGQLDSAPELAGEGEARSLSVSSLDEIKESVLRKVVREAVMLNLSSSPTLRA